MYIYPKEEKAQIQSQMPLARRRYAPPPQLSGRLHIQSPKAKLRPEFPVYT